MPAEEQDIARLLQDIKSTQDRVSADMEWLVRYQAGLDRRLGRVEDSVIFRSLRWIGRMYAHVFSRQTNAYTQWRKRGGGNLPQPMPAAKPRFTLLVQPADRERITRAVQPYENCEVMVGDWAETVARSTGDYVAMVGKSDEVYAGALQHFAAVAGSPDLIYSDEELLDESCDPKAPRFKPGWSPVLLRSVNYLGGLTAIRRELAAGHADLLNAIRAHPGLSAVHVPAVLYGSRSNALPKPPVTPVPASSGALVSLIVCTRTASLLEACLIGVQSATDFTPFEIIVVQHLGSSSAASEQAVAQVIAARGAKCVPYAAPFNFSAMNNLGAESATGSILLFLNDDVTPLRPDWLRRMEAWLRVPEVGAVGAKLTFPDGRLQHSGIAAWMTDGAWHPGRNMPPHPNWPWTQYTREVSAVTGACLAIRAADFRRLGGFDIAFPVNFNDVDLCFRLRREGFSIILDAEAELRHDESRTRSGGTSYEERHAFFRKWRSELQRPDPFYTPHLAQNNEDLSLR